MEIIASQLEAWGFLVSTAASAMEAQAHLNAAQTAGTLPQIIVLDWHMPEQNGVDWLLGVRRRAEWKSIPAIMSDEETPGIVKAQIREIKAALVAWVIASSGSFVLFVLAATRNNM